MNIKICEYCRGQGIKRFSIPDWDKYFSLPVEDENVNLDDIFKIYEDFCPVCHGVGYVDGSAAFVENHDDNVVQLVGK